MQNSLPIVSIAKSEVCATKLEDKVLQMQTLIGLPYDERIDALLGLMIDDVKEDTKLRSHNTAGKRVKQEAMLIVIKFITNLKVENESCQQKL